MSSEELRRYWEALGGGWEDRLGRHLDDEELMAYHRGQLEAIDADAVQSHLVQCDRCLMAFKDVADFFDDVREGEEPVGERLIRREWRAFQRRLREEEAAVFRRSAWFPPRALFALAASALVAVGLVTLWALHLRQERQQLAQQLHIEQTRRLELEREHRRLQERADAVERGYASRVTELESQLARLREPQLNIPVYDVFSREALLRSGQTNPVNGVTVSPGARSFTLVLNGEGLPEYPSYAIEMVDRQGVVRWRAVGWQRDRRGNFTLTLDRAFLSPGTYRLTLYGQQRKRLHRIAEYLVALHYR